MVRRSKIQVSKIAVYWAVFTFAISVLWTVSLHTFEFAGIGPALSLIGPMILGVLASVLFYFSREHHILEFDDEGFEVTKGRRSIQKRKWAEFKECSVIRDSYGRNKVRAYTERDGSRLDIDPSTCGINPFEFRDFMATRIGIPGGVKEGLDDAVVFEGLEAEIQRGRAGWIADLNETFLDYQISGEAFPLIARGTTRPKGFLLSRFVAMTIMPNYEVCLYAHDIRNPETAQRSHIMHLIRIIETQRDQKNIKWSWLLLFCNQELPSSLARVIEEFGNKDVGIGCIDVGTGKLITSPNQLGRSLARQMRLQHLIRDLRRRTRRPPTLQS